MSKCVSKGYRAWGLVLAAVVGGLVWAKLRNKDAAGPGRGAEAGRLLERLLPTYDATHAFRAVVDASPEETFTAVKEVDFARIRSPLVHLLGWLRIAPERMARWLRGQPPSAGTSGQATGADLQAWGWIPLGEEPGRELAMGLVGQFWKPEIPVVRLAPDQFSAFSQPGYAKVVADFFMRPYGQNQTLLTYEARTATTDAAARRRFRLYWRVIGWGAAYLMRHGLALIKEDAEKRHAAARLSGTGVTTPVGARNR